ncbi:Crp/Fnr family transcriptional regulator [Hydrogenophaga laconesensis]|uniref:CRP-like cAMP-binding protein n=1 Tax=Hydrogenophaga laconesensis TaxID=1805971 RepID=A0ABU1V5C5_9BURK|nr:Crp/Fnr family transcriptional regulator [Hydrogenophaga laconesensis]MDR7092664.1 CRP-like cAMP-binding protein [Hydrogenophaga laconesensis]
MTSTMSLLEKNHLLARLSSEEGLLLAPDLEWEELRAGAVLHQAGAELRHVYFPATATVSLVSSLEDGASSEVAVVGNEGVVGVCAFMGDSTALCDAVVQRKGLAYRIGTQALQHHVRRSPELMQRMLAYTQALLVHMAQSSACNRHHALDQQLCRWLLQHLDRQDDNDMLATQERIASLLGVRREGVTSGALKLQKAGLIEYHRGHISILDRDGLEARSCECYGVVRRAYERLACVHGTPHLLPREAAPPQIKRVLQTA